MLKEFLGLGLALILSSGSMTQPQQFQKTTAKTNTVQTLTAIDQPAKPYRTVSRHVSENTAVLPVKTGKKKQKECSITISAVGDCTFGSDRSSPTSVNFYAVKRRQNYDYFFKRVKKIFAADDLTIANFEGTLTKRGSRQPKRFAFRGDPSYVNILKKGSIEAVSFANNHCRDFGSISYQDTKKTLEQAGIKYASYSKVSIYKTKGIRIGMIAVNGLEGAWGSKKLIRSGIKTLKKKKADLIIVSMHAGIEHTSVVNGTQRDIGRFAIDHGANLVLGHHPHVLQGIEKYKGKFIVYSLGNFCFGGNTNPSDKDTMIFQQTFFFQKKQAKSKTRNQLKKKTETIIVPCSLSSRSNINTYQPIIAGKGQSARILKRLKRYSPTVKIQRRKGKSERFICE